MPSTVVSFLAQHSEDELQEMHSRLEAERIRIDVELDQVTEALSRKTRRTGAKPSQRSGTPRAPARPGATQKRILAAVARFEDPVKPAEIIAEMESKDSIPSKGSIHNTIGRLFRNGLLDRVGDGQYRLASRNGASSGASSGPNNLGSTDPLSRDTETQEAS